MDYSLSKTIEFALSKTAEESDMGFKHASMIIKGRNIFGVAKNMKCDEGTDHSIHAECSVLKNLKGKGASERM